MTGWAVLMGFVGLVFCPIVETVAKDIVPAGAVKWVVTGWILIWTVPPLFLIWTKGVFG